MATRDGSPPPTNTPVLAAPSGTSKARWIPPSVIKLRDISNPDDRAHSIFRRVRGVLNKLTPEKFDKLSLELVNVGIESQYILKGIILLIFEKALDEPKYSSLYAQLCKRLSEDAPNFEPPDSNSNTFRLLLVSKCRDEFDNRSKAAEPGGGAGGGGGEVEAEGDTDKEHVSMSKSKMLANIKFIGELGKLDMLHESILHRCIQQLLEKKKVDSVRDMGEDLECVCQILRTAGRNLDTAKAQSWMEQYFERIEYFSTHPDLPARIQFTLQDTLDLRKNNWVVRQVRMDKEAAPKTITEIRKAAEEQGVFLNKGSPGRDLMGRQNGFMPPTQFPLGPRMGGGIGTGPGVIQAEGFIPGYSTNMGRARHTIPPFNNNSPPNQQWKDNQGYNNRGQNNQSPNSMLNNSPVIKPGNQIRELPPRFQKLALAGEPTIIAPPDDGEVSLRPKTFALKPTGPSMLPKSAQLPPKPSAITAFPPPPNLYMYPPPGYREPMPDPILQKQAQITIKPSQDKPKNTKKNVMSKEETLAAAATMFETFMAKKGDRKLALATFKELAAPKRHIGDMLSAAMLSTLDMVPEKQDKLMDLFVEAKRENLITSHNFMEATSLVLSGMAEKEASVPLVKSQVARYMALATTQSIMPLCLLAEPMANGAHYPLFLLCLQKVAKIKDPTWLTAAFNENKINLLNLLPESERTKERLGEILDDRGLSFLLPLLRVHTDLLKQIQSEPTAQAVYKWVRENVNSSLHSSPEFINILMTCMMKYITEQTAAGTDSESPAPEKAVIEREQQLFKALKGVVQKLVHDKLDLQVVAVYALQVYCHSLGFPKGMILRFFRNLYDLEVIDEEAFLRWKEEVNDQHPGKGKALFQVNQWLTWLEQAEEESDENDEEN